MIHESFIPDIINQYDKLTSVEKVIADYFIKNKNKDDFTIKSMKERLFVSEASLSRFAKRMGFKGYREFIYAYEQTFIQENEISLSSEVVLGTYDELLQRFIEVIDDKQLSDIAQQMTEHKRIIVIGIGSSGLAAEEMKRRFLRIGLPIESCDQGDMMRMQSIFQSKETMIIGFSISGNQEDVLFTIKQAHNNGSLTVLVSGPSLKRRYIDYQVSIPSLKNLDAGNLISPQFPMLVIIDMLYHECLRQDKNKEKYHEETLTTLKREGQHI